jgi:hypothetical protein
MHQDPTAFGHLGQKQASSAFRLPPPGLLLTRKQKKIGAYNLLQMQQGLEAILLGTLPHAKPKPWSKDEIMVFLADIRKDFQNPRIHGQYDL